VVREESHLDDMRAAIRGDFERLEERRGEQELMRPPVELAPQAPAEPQPDPQPPPEPERLEESPASIEISEDPPRRSWLDRLLGR